MSRRHHGRSRHGRPRPDLPRATTGTTPAQRTDAAPEPRAIPAPPTQTAPPTPAATPTPAAVPAILEPERPASDAAADRGGPSPTTLPAAAAHTPMDARPPTNGAARPSNGAPPLVNGEPPPANGCTAPQLRRFIKSRPYVPMHELRRRFAISGDDDDVTQVRIETGHLYVGLPEREGLLLGELLRGGEIGYELSLDPRTPIVIGVYPMRPVPRG